jgi:RIO kinase 1
MKSSEKEIVKAFARKEFKNLEICEKAGVHAPRPYFLKNNILVMEFLGEGELPYPTMEMLGPKNPEKELKSILEDVRRMYRAGLVHADLSEYNILNGDIPYLIDFSEGVVLGHPSASKFLERDVVNILKFYSKYGVKKDLEKVLAWIRA